LHCPPAASSAAIARSAPRRGRSESWGLLQNGALVRWYIVDFGVFAELQHPNIGSDAPTVVRFHARSVARHGAKAIGHDIEKVPDRRFDQLLGVIRRGLPKTTPHHHSISIPDPAVTRRTVDVKPLLAAKQIS